MAPIPIAIGDIKLHPVFKQPEVVEHLITTEFVLKEPQQLFCPEIVPYLLELHPIQVISGKNDKHFCVGGLRTLSIVRNILPPTDKIDVVPLVGIRREDALNRCLIDLLITTSCFSLSSRESIYRTMHLIPQKVRDELLAAQYCPSKIARILQVHLETVRQWNKRTKINQSNS